MRAEPAGPADLSLPELLALTVEGALGAAGSAGVIVGDGPGGGGRGSGAPAPAPAGRPAWWDGVSHVVTRPDPRARHLTREHVT